MPADQRLSLNLLPKQLLESTPGKLSEAAEPVDTNGPPKRDRERHGGKWNGNGKRGGGCCFSLCACLGRCVPCRCVHLLWKRFCSRGPNILLRRIYIFLYIIRVLAVVYGVLLPLAVSFSEHTVQHHTATALALMCVFLYTLISMLFYQLYLYNRKPFK